MRHPALLNIGRSGLVVVDVQEKFISAIYAADEMIDKCSKLVQAFRILERPVIVTEQYPDGLGKTVESITSLLPDLTSMEKMAFSCCAIPDFVRKLREIYIHQVVLCGIEAHVCIWQTAMDLRAEGFKVTLVEDAVSSRSYQDKQIAIQRLHTHGIEIASLEMVLFELMITAAHPHFKEIQTLIK